MKSKKTLSHVSKTLLLALLIFSSFSSFAKRELSYIDLTPTIKSSSSLNVCIATLDQREVVLLERQAPEFVGYIRSAVAIAYPIKTKSKLEFSEVMSTTVADALKQNGSTASVLKTNFKSKKEDVLTELKTQEADIFILITMNKWRTDTKAMSGSKVATDLIYDLELEIYNKSGELIASYHLDKEEPQLAPAMSSPIKKIQTKVINMKYPEVMTNFFSNAEIEKALQ